MFCISGPGCFQATPLRRKTEKYKIVKITHVQHNHNGILHEYKLKTELFNICIKTTCNNNKQVIRVRKSESY